MSVYAQPDENEKEPATLARLNAARMRLTRAGWALYDAQRRPGYPKSELAEHGAAYEEWRAAHTAWQNAGRPA